MQVLRTAWKIDKYQDYRKVRKDISACKVEVARVTREIAERIARVSRALEQDGHPTEEVAMFLMRVLFSMFAEDVGLLPPDSFKEVLTECKEKYAAVGKQFPPKSISPCWAKERELGSALCYF